MPVITFIVNQSDSFISLCFFFTTDRWPQLQASYCFQRGLKICVASPRRAAKCFAKLSPKPIGSAGNASVHLFILHLIRKCHPILIKQAARTGSSATCFFFCFVIGPLAEAPCISYLYHSLSFMGSCRAHNSKGGLFVLERND